MPFTQKTVGSLPEFEPNFRDQQLDLGPDGPQTILDGEDDDDFEDDDFDSPLDDDEDISDPDEDEELIEDDDDLEEDDDEY